MNENGHHFKSGAEARSGKDLKGRSLRALASTHASGDALVSGTIDEPVTLKERLFAKFSGILYKATKKAEDQSMKV